MLKCYWIDNIHSTRANNMSQSLEVVLLGLALAHAGLGCVCPMGWAIRESTGRCYLSSSYQNVTSGNLEPQRAPLYRAEAQVRCQQEGGDLTCLQTYAEWEYVKNLTMSSTSGNLSGWWISAHEVGTEYKWSDGSPITETWAPWDPNKGNETGVIITENFTWKTENEDSLHHYVCERDSCDHGSTTDATKATITFRPSSIRTVSVTTPLQTSERTLPESTRVTSQRKETTAESTTGEPKLASTTNYMTSYPSTKHASPSSYSTVQTITTTDKDGSDAGPHLGIIIGSIAGVLLLLILVAILVYIVRKRKSNLDDANIGESRPQTTEKTEETPKDETDLSQVVPHPEPPPPEEEACPRGHRGPTQGESDPQGTETPNDEEEKQVFVVPPRAHRPPLTSPGDADAGPPPCKATNHAYINAFLNMQVFGPEADG